MKNCFAIFTKHCYCFARDNPHGKLPTNHPPNDGDVTRGSLFHHTRTTPHLGGNIMHSPLMRVAMPSPIPHNPPPPPPTRTSRLPDGA